jgi:hypothetical protein
MADPGLIWLSGTSPIGDGKLQLGDPTLTGDVDWAQLLGDVRATANLPAGEGWTAAVSRGSRVLVAEREQPTRQVWIGFWSDAWARRPGFVIFCTRALDWVGGGAQAFDSRGPGQLPAGYSAADGVEGAFGKVASEPGFWPGVYRGSGSEVATAVNAGALPEGRVMGNDDLARLATLAQDSETPSHPATLESELSACAAILAALGMLALGSRAGLS